MASRTLHNAATSWITYYSTFPAGTRGGALVGGLGDEVKSSYKQIVRIFGSNSHTIYEVQTLIIENENYEAQLQSANSAPIRTTFIQRMKKMSKTAGDPNPNPNRHRRPVQTLIKRGHAVAGISFLIPFY